MNGKSRKDAEEAFLEIVIDAEEEKSLQQEVKEIVQEINNT